MTSYIILSKKTNYKRRNLLQFYFSVLIIILIFIIPILYISNKCDWKQFNNSENFKVNKDRLKSSNPGPQLSFYSFQIDDDNSGNSQGDSDGNIDAGETIELRLILENTGDEDALNVNATMTSLNDNITITNGFQDFITIAQNSTGISSSYYIFKIYSSCSSDYYITIDLEINASNGGPWIDNFQIHVIGSGNPVYQTYFVYSESDGDLIADNDDIIDAGEVIVFDITVKNLGGANLYGVNGIIEEDDPYTTIDDNTGNFGTINGHGGTNTGRFGITISGACTDKHQINLNLNLTDNEGTLWETNFFLVVNGTTDYEINFHVIEYSGDGDNYVDAGERWYASISIKNIGEVIGHDVIVFLDSTDPYVSFTRLPSYRDINYGTINVNSTASYSDDYYWRFEISDVNIPDNYEMKFVIRITDSSGYEEDYEVIIVIVKGGFVTDWVQIGIIALIVIGIIGICGIVYASHHYHWRVGYKIINKFSNYSANRYIKKEKNVKEKDHEVNTFESLARKSKDLVNKGKQLYSKESFISAVEKWDEAINIYNLCMKKASGSQDKAKIKENLMILRQNICNAYIENGKKHNLTAKKAHKVKDIQKAQKEWNSAIKDFQIAIDLTKSEKLDLSYNHLDTKIKAINLFLNQLEIEKTCFSADSKLEKARSLQNTDLNEAATLVQKSFIEYSDAKKQAKAHPEFQELIRRIQTKMENTRNFQLELQDKMDELIGITPLTTPVIIEDEGDLGEEMEGTIIKPEKIPKALLIKREHELIGGQVRFKVALINNTRTALTALKISFDIPDALKWVMYEPKYEHKGDSILIPKLSINEKKTVSLYLEPINCLNSPVNATVSFFDAKDRPQAIVMDPKWVSITCPIFFTKEEANLARLKRLQRTLNHQQKKLIPISNIEKIPIIFSTILSVVGKRDIKLVYKEFSAKDKLGEAWFYGVTKVKEKRLIIYILLDGEINALELKVSGDNDEHITGFLAEISNEIRQELLKHKVISVDDRFYNMRCSVLSSECPFCGAPISAKLVEKYEHGESINCIYCGKLIPNINKI